MENILKSLCAGNPGAITIILQLNTEGMLTSKLINIMIKNDIVNSKIWEKYKEHNKNIYEFHEYLLSLNSNNTNEIL
jgi:hypothetical protein